MKITISITPLGVACIREETAGKFHRRTLAPGVDISGEPQEVYDACAAAWTPEIIAAYEAHKAQQNQL